LNFYSPFAVCTIGPPWNDKTRRLEIWHDLRVCSRLFDFGDTEKSAYKLFTKIKAMSQVLKCAGEMCVELKRVEEAVLNKTSSSYLFSDTNTTKITENSHTIGGLPEKPYSSLTGCPSKKINFPQIILSYNKGANKKQQQIRIWNG